MAGMSYSALLMDHYEHPRNAGVFADSVARVASATVGTPALGGVIQLQIQVQDGQIAQTRFKAYGGVPVIACASLASEWLVGKTPAEALAMDHTALVQALELPAGKLPSAMLAEDAIRAVVQAYQANAAADMPIV